MVNAGPPPTAPDHTQKTVLTDGLNSVIDILKRPGEAARVVAVGFVWTLGLVLATGALEKAMKSKYGKWTEAVQTRFPGFAARIERFIAPLASGSWGALVSVLAINVAVLGFADPNFGFYSSSIRLILSILLAEVMAVVVPYRISALLSRRVWGAPTVARSAPWGLMICMIGVLMSRAIGFVPGLMSGSTVRLDQGSATIRQQVRTQQVRAILTMALGVAYWALSVAIPERGRWLTLFFHDAAVAGAIIAFTSTVIEMLPFAFYAGGLLYAYSRRSWYALMACSTILFAFVVVPQRRYWINVGSQTMWWVTIAALVSFGIVGVLVFVHRTDVRSGRGQVETA